MTAAASPSRVLKAIREDDIVEEALSCGITVYDKGNKAFFIGLN
jgi:hypothetical protein